MDYQALNELSRSVLRAKQQQEGDLSEITQDNRNGGELGSAPGAYSLQQQQQKQLQFSFALLGSSPNQYDLKAALSSGALSDIRSNSRAAHLCSASSTTSSLSGNSGDTGNSNRLNEALLLEQEKILEASGIIQAQLPSLHRHSRSPMSANQLHTAIYERLGIGGMHHQRTSSASSSISSSSSNRYQRGSKHKVDAAALLSVAVGLLQQQQLQQQIQSPAPPRSTEELLQILLQRQQQQQQGTAPVPVPPRTTEELFEALEVELRRTSLVPPPVANTPRKRPPVEAAAAAAAPPAGEASVPLKKRKLVIANSAPGNEYSAASSTSFLCASYLCNNKTKEEGPSVQQKKRGRSSTFPKSLHNALTCLEASGQSNIASFTPNGKAFAIHNRNVFVQEIMPKFFKMTSMCSFQRQINLYNIKRITSGPNEGAYTHPLLQRGQPVLASTMRRNQVKQSPFVLSIAAQAQKQPPAPATKDTPFY